MAMMMFILSAADEIKITGTRDTRRISVHQW